MTPLAPHISAFFVDHLADQRDASPNTRETYSYSFQLLLEYASTKIKIAPSKLCLEHIDSPLVSSFLEHLESCRQNSPSTRNVRLSAIKSFFRFLEYRVPEVLRQIRMVLAIPSKKTDSRLVPYLKQDEMQAIIDAPDLSTEYGIRDRAMLYLAFTAGLRASELIGLRMEDLTLQPSPNILVRGKGC